GTCGATPAPLVESELFGPKRGAFSGAEDRVGLFRNAERGTLFLDEICELPLESQAALLRVVQQKELTPLGASRAVTVDVRIVAATNRVVTDEIAEGKFRRDLYARLSSYELPLPPLRERREDLGLLVATVIATIAPPSRARSRAIPRGRSSPTPGRTTSASSSKRCRRRWRSPRARSASSTCASRFARRARRRRSAAWSTSASSSSRPSAGTAAT